MKKALDLFRTLEKVLLVLPMAFLCICIFINILMRAFFQSGISWLEEFSRYAFVFSTFLGASIAVESDQHPKMTGPRRGESGPEDRGQSLLRRFEPGGGLLRLPADSEDDRQRRHGVLLTRAPVCSLPDYPPGDAGVRHPLPLSGLPERPQPERHS